MPSLRGMRPLEITKFLDNYAKVNKKKKDRKPIDKDLIAFLKRDEVKEQLYKDGKVNVKVGGTIQKSQITDFLNANKQELEIGIGDDKTKFKIGEDISDEELRRLNMARMMNEEEKLIEQEEQEEQEEKQQKKKKQKDERKDKKKKLKLKISKQRDKKQGINIPKDIEDIEDIDDIEDEPVVARMVSSADDVEEVDISTAMANTRGGMKRRTQQQPRGRFIGSPSTSQRVGSASTAQPPPVMSPDGLTEEQERNIQSTTVKKAQKEMFDRLLRENPDFLPQSKSSKEQFKQTDVENIKVSRVSDIPNSRASSDFKTVKQLNDDIKYFFSNFGEALKDEEARYKSMSKTSKKLVLDMHKRIVAKLGVKSSNKKGENIGVVIDGKDYVKKMVNEILLTQSASKLRPDDLIINVTDPEQKKDKDLSDIGTYEVKGGRSVQREPIYQFIPTDNSDVYKESKKPNRITKLAMPKTKAETYQKEYKQNEFARPPKNKPVRLKYLY